MITNSKPYGVADAGFSIIIWEIMLPLYIPCTLFCGRWIRQVNCDWLARTSQSFTGTRSLKWNSYYINIDAKVSKQALGCYKPFFGAKAPVRLWQFIPFLSSVIQGMHLGNWNWSCLPDSLKQFYRCFSLPADHLFYGLPCNRLLSLPIYI